LGESGEIIVSHISETSNFRGLVINKRMQKFEGIWEYDTLLGPPSAPQQALIFPRMITNGTNHETVHIITSRVPSPNDGNPFIFQDPPIYYYRSSDMGETWEIQNYVFPELNEDYYLAMPFDGYAWAQPKGDTIAFVIGDKTIDMVLMKSTDSGNSWQKKVIWEHPYPFLFDTTTVTDTFYCNNGSMSIAMDNLGKVHVAFGIDRWMPLPSNPVIDTLYADGIGYWNEDMPVFGNSLNALHPDSLLATGNLVGWAQDIDGDGEVIFDGLLFYKAQGISSMPALAIDEMNNLYLVFSSITEFYSNFNFNYRHLWSRRYSNDDQAWGEFYDINGGLVGGFDENVFPSLSYNAGHLGLIYQYDPEPGTAIHDQHAFIENQIVYTNLDEWLLPATGIKQPQNIFFSIYPNPTDGKFSVKINDIETADLKIFNAVGQTVFSFDKNHLDQNVEIDLSDQPNGIYFIKLNAKGETQVEKLVLK
jgi:hypothetical protein